VNVESISPGKCEGEQLISSPLRRRSTNNFPADDADVRRAFTIV
jgi:hypothetical protein